MKVDSYLNENVERERANAKVTADREGIAVICDDWMYWRIYGKDHGDGYIGLRLNDWKVIQEFINRETDLNTPIFYSQMLDELCKFCKDCKQNCENCNVFELKHFVERRI